MLTPIIQDAAQRALATALATALVQQLAAIVPTLSPAQKVAFIQAYAVGVDALVAQGLLAPDQAALLITLATAL